MPSLERRTVSWATPRDGGGADGDATGVLPGQQQLRQPLLNIPVNGLRWSLPPAAARYSALVGRPSGAKVRSPKAVGSLAKGASLPTRPVL